MQATSEKSRERFAKRKQLMPRERIALLLDRGAPFLELMPLAGYRMHDDKDGIERRRRLGRRHRLCRGRALRRHRVELRDQGRHRGAVRPAQGPARPAGRDGEQAAGREPRRIGRRQPALPGRDLRAGRPRLRQPGAHVGARHPAGHRRARLLDRGRRLPARPVATTSSWCATRPRCSWPARRCSRPRPARSRPTRSWAARRCTPPSRASPNGWPRTTPTASAWRARSSPGGTGTTSCRPAPHGRSRSRSTTSTSCAASCRRRTRIPTTCAR